MTQQIEFIDFWGNTDSAYHPKPASAFLPEWYKQTDNYVGGEKVPNFGVNPLDRTSSTIKKCRPVFDSITAGYIIPLPVDIYIKAQDDGTFWFEWSDRDAITFHPPRQFREYPGHKNDRGGLPKFMSPWVIKTPPGYSCLYTTPAHRGLPFHILEAIVDTDTYFNEVHFPFEVNDPNFEGILEAGSPMVQVIPFKRDSWKHSVREAGDADRKERAGVHSFLGSVFNGAYAKRYWSRKEYR